MNTKGPIGEGLRQRKRRETRAALSQAAIRLCTQRGWENVTVDEIAEAANVSPRTFRNYFSTKAEAVAAVHLERMLRIADELRARPADEQLWTAITNSVCAQFESPGQKGKEVKDVSRLMDRIHVLSTEPAFHGEILKASASAQSELAKAITERIDVSRANELYPQLVAAVVIAVVGVVTGRWLRDGPSGSIIPLMRTAFDLVAAGLSEDKTTTGRYKLKRGK
jgi:AcrR family transcriptional regulator